MPEVTQLIVWEALIFLFALFGIVVIQILTGAINARGLLEGTTSGGTRFKSTGRVQLLIATIVTAVQYLSQVVDNSQKFPDIPQNWLLLFGSSQVIYLVVIANIKILQAKGSYDHLPVLPDVPNGVLALLGISASSYAVSKAIQHGAGKSGNGGGGAEARAGGAPGGRPPEGD